MTAILVHNAVVVPIEPAGVVYDRGWVRIDGRVITALGPGPAPESAAAQVIDARGGLLLPGFVSAHQHLLDVLLRGGIPTGPGFYDWLLGLYYTGMAVYEPADAGLATMLAGTETIRAGITCVADNWGIDCGDSPSRLRECAEASLDAYRRLGLRVEFARMFGTVVPDAWPRDALPVDPARLVTTPDAAFDAIEALLRDFHGSADGRIRIAPAPELPEMLEPSTWRATVELAEKWDTIVATHLLASPSSRAVYPAERLDALGVLSPRLVGAHCTCAEHDDLTQLAARGVNVAHCPSSNAFGGVVPPIRGFLEAGLTIGLGSDNASLNRNADILAEARRAVLTARIQGADRDVLTARRAVEMATIEGARALRLDAQIGSLVPGKKADLIVVDTDGPHWWPRHDWLETLVFQGKSSDVRTVVIDGAVVLDDRRLAALDPDAEAQLCRDAQRAAERILDRCGLTPPRPAL